MSNKQLRGNDEDVLGLSLSSSCQFRKPKAAHPEKVKAVEAWKSKSKMLGKLVLKIEDQFMGVQQANYADLMDKISQMVKVNIRGTFGYIPTALIKVGVNMSDNSAMFDLIEVRLKSSRLATNIVRLTVSDVTSMANIMTKLTSSLITQDISRAIFGEKKPKRIWQQSLSYSSLLRLWKKHATDVSGPLVVLIPELDRVDLNNGLRHLFPTIKLHLVEFPVVLICGAYTSAISLQNLLPAKATDCLFMETFVLKAPRDLFEEVLNKVLICSDLFAFKLGPRIIEALVDNFMFHDFSLQGMASVVRTCLFRHFYSNNVSSKLGYKNDYRISGEFTKLSTKELNVLYEDIKNLPSVADSDLKSIATEPQALKDFFKESLINLKSHHKTFIQSLNYLFLLTCELPEKPFGSSFSSLYALALDKDLVKTAECESAFTSLKFLSVDEFRERFQTCLNNIDSGAVGLKTLFEEHLVKIDQLDSQLDDDSAATNSTPKALDLGKCKSRSEWKSKLKTSIVPRSLTRFELWRNEFLDDLKNELSALKSPHKLPLHEVIYYNDINYVVSRCFPSQRSETIALLRNPFKQLEALHELPDKEAKELEISVIFESIRESTTSINLRDALDEFLSHMESTKTSPTKKKKTKGKADEENKELMARFFNCIEDLEFTGFVQKNKRKCDHLTKLVWE